MLGWCRLTGRAEHRSGPRQVVRSIDAERNRVNERHADAHAGLERAQLLEPLPLLQRTWRQRREPLQNLAAIGVDADVMKDRSGPARRGRAGKIQRAPEPLTLAIETRSPP